LAAVEAIQVPAFPGRLLSLGERLRIPAATTAKLSRRVELAASSFSFLPKMMWVQTRCFLLG
jgi:hypothetical protein